MGARKMTNKPYCEVAYLPLVERMLKNHSNRSLTGYCPMCFHIINFIKDADGQWKQGMSCCHLRFVIVEDGKYIGKFSYQTGKFEGIKKAGL
jgi:hypothetical protein